MSTSRNVTMSTPTYSRQRPIRHTRYYLNGGDLHLQVRTIVCFKALTSLLSSNANRSGVHYFAYIVISSIETRQSFYQPRLAGIHGVGIRTNMRSSSTWTRKSLKSCCGSFIIRTFRYFHGHHTLSNSVKHIFVVRSLRRGLG